MASWSAPSPYSVPCINISTCSSNEGAGIPAPILGKKLFFALVLNVNYSINPRNYAKKQPKKSEWYNFRSSSGHGSTVDFRHFLGEHFAQSRSMAA
jgi:hypothetical protein